MSEDAEVGPGSTLAADHLPAALSLPGHAPLKRWETQQEAESLRDLRGQTLGK